MADFARRRPGMRTERDYVAVESMGHKTAEPIITICLDRGRYIVYGVSSHLCGRLSDGDREQIVETVHRILEERK